MDAETEITINKVRNIFELKTKIALKFSKKSFACSLF